MAQQSGAKDQKRGTSASVTGTPEVVIQEIAAAIAELKFGRITIVIQDGKVIQIEKTHKIRLA